MTPAVRDSTDTEQYVRGRLRALLNGSCSLEQFTDELPQLCGTNADAGWVLLALIDQHLRRGQLDPQSFHTVKRPLQRLLLGPGYDPPPGAVPASPGHRPLPARPLPARPLPLRPLRLSATVMPQQTLLLSSRQNAGIAVAGLAQPPSQPLPARAGLPAPGTAAHPAAGRHRSAWLLMWCLLITTAATLLQQTHWFPEPAAPAAVSAVAAATAGAPGAYAPQPGTPADLPAAAAAAATAAPLSAPRSLAPPALAGPPAAASSTATPVTARAASAVAASMLAGSVVAASAAAVPVRAHGPSPMRTSPVRASPARRGADAAPLQLSAPAYTVSAGQDVAAITVRRTAHYAGAIDFIWWTAADSAQPGLDFRAARVTARLPAGTDAMAFTIPIRADPARDSERRFYVVIRTAGSGAASDRAAVFIKPMPAAITDTARATHDPAT